MEFSQIYKITNPDPNPTDYYSNLIFERTGLLPSQCYKINDEKDLFVKFLKGAKEKLILGVNNLTKFKEIGLEVKLTSDQIDKHTIFVNSAPTSILDTDPDTLINEINKENPNLLALNIYAPPLKSYRQKLTSIKITLASRIMVNSCFKFGLKIKGCLIPANNIKQGLYLKIPQCQICQGFHLNRQCTREFPTCAHCGGRHKKFQCDSKNPRPHCINCRGPHRTTSNHCPIRREYLTEDFIGDTKEEDLTCPFQLPKDKETFTPAPTPESNCWAPQNKNTQQQIAQNTGGQAEAPLTTYNDCLKMATQFKHWYQAFLILQTLMGLKKIELPESLRDNINIDPQTTGPKNNTIFLDPTNNTLQNLPSPNPNENQTETSPFYLPQRKNLHPNSTSTRTSNQPSSSGQPLTGANLVPLPQRNNTGKRALLPTPTDPYTQVNRNTGAIPRHKAQPSNKENHSPITTQNTFQLLATPDNPDEPPFQFSTDDGWDFAKKATKPTKPINQNQITTLIKNTREQVEGENPTSKPHHPSQPTDPTSTPSTEDPNTISSSTTSISSSQKTTSFTQQNTKNSNLQPKINIQNKPIKPPIKTKPDLSKYKPTQEIPSFLRNKLPHNRHSMDPNQFRSTIQSFEALSNAALKQAEQEYTSTKEDFLLNTSLPEFQNKTKNPNTQTTSNTQENILNPSPKEGTNTKYTLGSTKTPEKSIPPRKQYKHPTPPLQNSDSDQEEVDIITQEYEDSDILPDLTRSPNTQHKKRLLRSHSRQNNLPSCS